MDGGREVPGIVVGEEKPNKKKKIKKNNGLKKKPQLTKRLRNLDTQQP